MNVNKTNSLRYRQQLGRLLDLFGETGQNLDDGPVADSFKTIVFALRMFYRQTPPGPAAKKNIIEDIPSEEAILKEVAASYQSDTIDLRYQLLAVLS